MLRIAAMNMYVHKFKKPKIVDRNFGPVPWMILLNQRH